MDSRRRSEIEACCVDEYVLGAPEVVESPSGRYRLTIRDYGSAAGGWNYSRGVVTRIADGATVCDIRRNFGVFHYSFVTKDGREHLITGRSYTSQTIVDLDLGQEYERADVDEDNDFIWVHCSISPDGETLVVDGCYWACPYEYKFFDVRDLARGWPELALVGAEHIDNPSNARAPEWLNATPLDCFHDDHANQPRGRTRVERRGNEIVVVGRV